MNRKFIRASILGALLVAGLGSLPAAANVDPADLAFWQSVQTSKNPKEYSAYLNAFPHGAFVELARERIKELGGQGAGPAPTATAKPAGLGPVVGKGTITVVPANPQVGDTIHLTLEHFPKLGSGELIIIVPAGSPDSVTNQNATGWAYGVMCVDNVANSEACKFGPLAPGTYEVRWLTQLYNNQQKYQVGARTQFTVSD